MTNVDRIVAMTAAAATTVAVTIAVAIAADSTARGCNIEIRPDSLPAVRALCVHGIAPGVRNASQYL